MDKYGFVYLWFDRKHKRYYVGSHWGTECDGYICSSQWMHRAKAKRPNDFKRRVISRIYTNRKDLLNEENRWLNMIKPEELAKFNTTTKRRETVRYYNLVNKTKDVWHSNEENLKTIGAKISAAKKGKSTGPCSPEKAKRISEAKKKKFAEKQEKLGYKFSEEHRKKMSENSKGKKHTEEWKQQNSERLKQQWANGERKSNGPLSEEHKHKQSIALKGRKLSSEQIELMKINNSQKYIIIKTDGSIIEVNGLKQFAADNNIPYQSLHVYYRTQKPMLKYNIQSINKK